MHRPYSNDFELTYRVTACALSVTLIGFIWATLPKRPLTRPLLTGAVTTVGLLSLQPLTPLGSAFGDATLAICLQLALTLATCAVFLSHSIALAAVSASAQCALFAFGRYLEHSELELVVLHQAWLGALLGILTQIPPVHVLAPPAPQPTRTLGSRLKSVFPDAAVGVLAVTLGAGIAWFVFDRLTHNGDEIAYVFQSRLFSHLEAYGKPPACAKMFENYWVFNYKGRLFSQYTPGWPLFMTPFTLVNLDWLAGPFSLALAAVGVARLARRLAWGLGATEERASRIRVLAGWLGALSTMLGPAMLLNGGSRFPHAFVSACFAWSVEALCAFQGATRRGTRTFWLLTVGLTTALGLATRPPDGAALGVGVFLYFVYLLVRRRLGFVQVLMVACAFASVALPVAIILRLQLGEWLKTGYDIVKQFHTEGTVRLSWPGPEHWKFGIPLAWGAHMWWPAAPALGLLGICRAMRGAGRNAAWMLCASSFVMVLFYIHVEFSRVSDNGLGPRYLLPLVVPMAAGTGAALAPLLASLGRALKGGPAGRVAPALVVLSTLASTCWIAPYVYPLAQDEYNSATAPLRWARDQDLNHAIVLLFPDQLPADWWNLAQNDPTDPDPKVLFLTRHSAADEACARKHYPGRTWHRALPSGKLTPYP